MSVHVKFWGTRGSIPRPVSSERVHRALHKILRAAEPEDLASEASIDAFIADGCRGTLPTVYGGNTACVQVFDDRDADLLIDFGSGAREYAGAVMRSVGPVNPKPFHVLMSHFHWDHIMGFPFFVPAYIPGNVINIYSCHDNVAEAFRRQHGPPSFPVPFDALGADIRFHKIDPSRTHEINGFQVTPHLLQHAGDAYGYRIEKDDHTVVYASDAEHKPEQVCESYPYIGFIRDADILIFDAQYSLAEATSVKEDWGHSSNVVGVELGLLGNVKHLLFFHHEPLNGDERLDQIVTEARRIEEIMRSGNRKMEITGAYDGLELVL